MWRIAQQIKVKISGNYEFKNAGYTNREMKVFWPESLSLNSQSEFLTIPKTSD